MSRRNFLIGAVAAGAALAAKPTTAADQAGWAGVISSRVLLAFDGLAYATWDASNQVLGFMAFFQTRSPDGQVPYTVTMSLLRAGQYVGVRPGNQFKQYRSTSLSGCATDWAVITQRYATTTLFLPYQCLQLPEFDTPETFSIYFRVLNSRGQHVASHDVSLPFRASVEPGQTLIQRIVNPAPGDPNEPPPPPPTVFSANLRTGEVSP